MLGNPRIAQMHDARDGFVDAAASRPACHVGTGGILAFVGSLVEIAVGYPSAACPYARPLRVVDGIVVADFGCTEEVQLRDSGQTRTSVDMGLALVV